MPYRGDRKIGDSLQGGKKNRAIEKKKRKKIRTKTERKEKKTKKERRKLVQKSMHQ